MSDYYSYVYSWKSYVLVVGIQIIAAILSCLYFPGVEFSIIPRESHLLTIFTGPLLHSDWEHLLSNLQLLIPLIVYLYVYYQEKALLIYFILYLSTNILLWFFGSYGAHVGLSGVAISLLLYVVLDGVISLEPLKVILSLLLGGMFYFVFTDFFIEQQGVSTEAHILGFFSGFVAIIVETLTKNKFKSH